MPSVLFEIKNNAAVITLNRPINSIHLKERRHTSCKMF